uniref:Uncharacterized protein n=1 Tax=Cacopsylla melanoneura TaxID=428564 RepID=A0A8D8ZQJ6_9HEMI
MKIYKDEDGEGVGVYFLVEPPLRRSLEGREGVTAEVIFASTALPAFLVFALLSEAEEGVVAGLAGGGVSTFCFLAAAVIGLSPAFRLFVSLLDDPEEDALLGDGVGGFSFSTFSTSFFSFSAGCFFFAGVATGVFPLAGVFFAAGVLSAAFFLAATMSGVDATFFAGVTVLAGVLATFFAGGFTEKSDPEDEGSSKSYEMFAPARFGRRTGLLLPDVDGTGESLILLDVGVLAGVLTGAEGFLAGGLFLLFFGVCLDLDLRS